MSTYLLAELRPEVCVSLIQVQAGSQADLRGRVKEREIQSKRLVGIATICHGIDKRDRGYDII